MVVADYLFARLYARGARHTFGIPGDFVLPLYAAQARSKLAMVVVTHEPSAGFAADAYARVRGLGVAMGTYGAGALNMVNAIAQAYAERSPVVVISGAPEIEGRNPDALLHHRVKRFDSQLAIYREITAASTVIEDAATAPDEIDRVLGTVLRLKRPGYIEIPRDIVTAALPRTFRRRRLSPASSSAPAEARDEAFAEIASRLARSLQPAILAGVDIERFGLATRLRQAAERLALPVATSLDGKAVFPEHHPQFVGTYMGEMGSALARRVVEGADCLLILGAYLTDTGTGLFTSQIDRRTVIHATADGVTVSHHRYPDVTLENVVALLRRLPPAGRPWARPHGGARELERGESGLTTDGVLAELSRHGTEAVSFTVDAGDCLFACARLNANVIINPGYYASMGFAVPAALGAALAAPERTAVAIVGDGAFQMTGMELSTFVRHGVHAVIVLLNNRGFASMAALDRPRPYFKTAGWDYGGVARALGARAVRVTDRRGLRTAFDRALRQPGVTLIEVCLQPTAVSRALRRMRAVVRGGAR
jgi:TPP-dependent 2-oxoacid decarboxylase